MKMLSKSKKRPGKVGILDGFRKSDSFAYNLDFYLSQTLYKI